jgi:hypothetical protein
MKLAKEHENEMIEFLERSFYISD